ncbi:MAG: hypothetical protein IKY58_00890 [Paludibacteraceae bacterium]|jgi:hypothetical protein|nr:hypothetical protein [Paludibacteraceae bacterium]
MPYRRLPKTNQARLRSLQKAVGMGEMVNLYELSYSYELWEKARGFLIRYERALFENKQCSENQFNTSKKQQESARNARMYISHFIQVLNMCVVRNEIKKEQKKLYGLDPESNFVPDLIGDDNLITWGRNIIEGEQKRLLQGGVPIYNPAIAKVRVHYDIFWEGYNNQKVLQSSTLRTIEKISELNKEADNLILKIWDEVEAFYGHLPSDEKIAKCKNYGLIYYYRKGEQSEENL